MLQANCACANGPHGLPAKGVRKRIYPALDDEKAWPWTAMPLTLRDDTGIRWIHHPKRVPDDRLADYPSPAATAQGSKMFPIELAESTGWSSTVLLPRGGAGRIGVPRGKWQMAQHMTCAPFAGELLQRLVDGAADVVLLGVRLK